MSIFLPVPALHRPRRVVQVLFGTALVGVGQAFMVRSELGLAPWEVLAQGVAKQTDIGIGTAGIVIAFAILMLWVPLRQRMGVGTLVNPLIAGTVVNFMLEWLDSVSSPTARIAFLAIGTFAFSIGVGIYLAAGLGPGPRDGIMTAIAAWGHSIRIVRTVLEVAVLVAGFTLGGTVGIGTVIFAFSVGPIVQFTLQRAVILNDNEPS